MNLIGTLDWAEANVTLDGRPFRRGDWPQIVPAVEAMDRGTGRTVILMMPPQRGKTLAGQLRLARNLAVSPRRQLWYSKTHNDARSVSDSKLGPLLKACPGVQRVTYTDPDARGRGLLFRFHNSPVELLSADVVAHRNSRSGQELYLDEAWQYEPRAIAEIYARGESYRWRRQVNIMSTAPDRGHEFDVLWESSSRNEWHVACPHCGHVFAPVWSRDQFVWEESLEDDGRINVEASAPTVRLKPPCCGVVTAWSPAICKAMNDPARGAGYKPLNATPDPSVDGFRFNVLATDDWAKFAREWMRAMNAMRAGDRQPMREVRLKKLCIPWDEAR
ncbi:MAG: Verrucomicrobia phage, partial [Verrucomicrobiota bacterium]